MQLYHSHWNREQGNSHCDTPDCEKAIAHPLVVNPVVDVEGQSKREQILDKIHNRECLTSFLAMAINNVCNDTSGAKLNTEIDEPQTYNDRYGPWILCI